MARRFINAGSLRQMDSEELQKIEIGLNKLEQTIKLEDQPCIHGTCYCMICNENLHLKLYQQKSKQKQSSQQCDKWLLKMLNGLFLAHTPSLILFIGDICFADGNTLQVFHTDPKDNRIKKISGVHPQRTLYPLMIKLRKKYKWMLGENYKRKLNQALDPSFMHEKYMDNVIPSFLNKAEMMSQRENKKIQKNIVLHKNLKLVDQTIQEHKLQQNQSFCTVKFKNGVSQIFTKVEFERWTQLRNKNMLKTAQISYVQSFIKQKQQTQAFFISTFTLNQEGYGINDGFDQQLYDMAQNQILVLLGGISKYSNSYKQISYFQDFTQKLGKNDQKKYIKLMTYKIVHYLGMVSRIYIKHIKINWILNDIDQIYLQNIIEFQTIQVSIKPLKYRLPPKEKDSSFYKDSKNFLQLYNQIQYKTQQKRKKIRSQFQKEQVQQDIFVMPPINSYILTHNKHNQTLKINQNAKALGKKKVEKGKSFIAFNSSRNPSIENKFIKNPSKNVRNNSFFSKRRHNSESKKFQL